jgi:hypothetical protein
MLANYHNIKHSKKGAICMKPITGQYECMHHSGVGLNYFTSRIDRLVLYPDGRFILSVQQMSRAASAAKSWFNRQTVNNTPPEIRQEGRYTQQQQKIMLTFDNGGSEEAQLAQNEDGVQIGPNYFSKVSDSPTLPSAQRMKQDMDDIAKGLKIASTLGSVAMKAAKTVQGAINSGQSQGNQAPMNASTSATSPSTQSAQSTPPNTTQTPPHYQGSSATTAPGTAPNQQPPASTASPTANTPGARFCDQCGERARPGKRFCNNCGAQII